MCISIELDEACVHAQKINVYKEGKIVAYVAGEKNFENILISWKNMLCGAHDMPAFGVSINSETVKAMKSGLWVEFVFSEIYECNGMPFEKLLINVEKDNCGFNVIRYSAERGYDGRCFYYDLVGKNMGDFCNVLLNL